MLDLLWLARGGALAVGPRLIELDSCARERLRGRAVMRVVVNVIVAPTSLRTAVAVISRRLSPSRDVLYSIALATVLAIRRIDPEHLHKSILAGRGHHVVPLVVAGGPGDVAHEVLMRDLQGEVERARAWRRQRSWSRCSGPETTSDRAA